MSLTWALEVIDGAGPTTNQAEPLLSSAIDAYAPERAREVALYRTRLAESYARAGVFDGARFVLGKAETAASKLGSARLDRRVNDVARMLAGVCRDSMTL